MLKHHKTNVLKKVLSCFTQLESLELRLVSNALPPIAELGELFSKNPLKKFSLEQYEGFNEDWVENFLQIFNGIKDLRLNVESQVLWGNKISMLFPQLNCLTRLNMRGCKNLSNAFFENLSVLTSLEELNLRYTRRGGTDKAIENSLTSLSCLKCLVFSDERIFSFLSKLTSLQQLKIQKYDDGRRAIQEPYLELQHMKNLRSLDISSTHISEEYLKVIFRKLPSLEKLRVCSKKITPSSLEQLVTLKELYLSTQNECEFGKGSFPHLVRLIIRKYNNTWMKSESTIKPDSHAYLEYG